MTMEWGNQNRTLRPPCMLHSQSCFCVGAACSLSAVGWVVTGREHDRACGECERIRAEDLRRYEELKAERDEWKAAALRNLNVAERAVHTVARAAEKRAAQRE